MLDEEHRRRLEELQEQQRRRLEELQEEHRRRLEEQQRSLGELQEEQRRRLEEVERPLRVVNDGLEEALAKMYALKQENQLELDSLRGRHESLLAEYTAAYSPATQPLTPDEYAQVLPLARLLHASCNASYTPLATPLTRLLHASFTPLARLLHAANASRIRAGTIL